MGTRRRTTPLGLVASATALAVCATLAPAAPTSAAPGPAQRRADDPLYLVTLRTPGTSGSSSLLPRSVQSVLRLSEQNDVLAAVGSPDPVYRWTTALNGFAVRLDGDQVSRLRASDDVLDVEADSVRPLASRTTTERVGAAAGPTLDARGPRHGGRDVVVGVVDTGLAPDSPVFAQRTSLAAPKGFTGACETAPDWAVAECTGKVVGARTYVAGFDSDRLRAATTVSPFDTDGHGTRTASLAVGNARVPVEVDGERLGTFGGQAPDARLAVYKACWRAPDPVDDGCSTADLVSAVDDATREGVDVLTLAVGGPAGTDVLERALLGATESGVVVVAASGNEGSGAAAHTSPWVTTVGGTAGDVRRGRVVLPDGRRLSGAMLTRRALGPVRLVRAAQVAADGARVADARVCLPGSLDAARVDERVVVCDRGRVGRVDKSRAVALADGVGMVLVNRGRGSVDADVHSVPTIHLAAGAGRVLLRWLRSHPAGRVRLDPVGHRPRQPRVASFSGSGGVRAGVLEPDLVAPASSVLAAAPGRSGSWVVASGTSIAAARTAGVAAVLLGRGMRPEVVRSALVTTARPVRGSDVARGGGGLLRAREARRPGLAVLTPVGGYRAWLDGDRSRLNTPSILLTGRARTATRRITNVSGRRLYFSSSTRGLRGGAVATPAAVRLGPGESATFRIRFTGKARRLDDGYVMWRGATGTVTRIPVVRTARSPR